MSKFLSVLFLVLFSFSSFAQTSLLNFGQAEVSGKRIIGGAPMAPIVFINQPPDAQNGFFTDTCWSGGQQSIADNFAVTSAGPTFGITEIKFWGGYFAEDIPNTTDNFTIILHSDAGGNPGANIYARHNLQATSRVPTGIIIFGTHEYLFTFDFTASPMIIANTGTYWIEIYNCSTLSDAFYWETGTLDATHGVSGNNWSQQTPGVTWNGPTGLESSIIVNGSDNVVPVELVSFEASTNGTNVDLNWATATETNNQGFEVQRSSGSEFKTIAFVDGHGTTTQTQVYSYTDRNVNVGSYSYRLKQVDFDGSFNYSKVIEVNVLAPAVFALDQNYPNPFNPSTMITFSLAVDSKVSMTVFNVLGQEVASLLNGNLVAGSHQVNFDASSLNSGVYMYRIEASGIDGTNFVDVKKMILTK
jgi:hypothetical protein